MNHTCAHCGDIFTAAIARSCCSRACAAQHGKTLKRQGVQVERHWSSDWLGLHGDCMPAIAAYLKAHPWSTAQQISKGAHVSMNITYGHLATLCNTGFAFKKKYCQVYPVDPGPRAGTRKVYAINTRLFLLEPTAAEFLPSDEKQLYRRAS